MSRKITQSEEVLKTPYFTITKDSYLKANGEAVDEYYTIDRPDVAIVVAITEEKEIILVNQYRHPLKKTGLEVPAGHIEEGESPEQGAARELLEETGYQSSELILLSATYASVGLLNQKLHVFLAPNCKKTKEPEFDPTEEIEIVLKPLSEANQLLSQFQDIDSQAAILLALNHLKND